MNFKPYPKYKASGVEWLGDVPQDWEFYRAKWLFELMGRPPGDNDGIVTAFRDGEVTLRKNRREDGFTNSIKEIGYQGVRKNDLVIHVMDAFAGAIGVSDSDGKSTPVYSVCTARKSGVDTKYFARFLRNMALTGFINSLAKGIRERSTEFRFKEFSEILLPLPPLAEQSQINQFLDRETAKIDTLIAKQEAMIGLLKEKRQAVISHAVTKGLDPCVPMKASGVEWLGDVPAHWNAAPLKRFIKDVPGAIKTGPFGSQLTAAEMQTGSIKVYNQRSVIDSDFDSGENYITEQKFSDLRAFEILPGDILVTTRGTIGRAAVFPDDAVKGILHPCLLRIQVEPRTLLRAFLLVVIQDSHLLASQIKLLSNSTTIEVIYSETMASVVISLPPLAEQQTIVDFLRKTTNRIDTLIDKAQQAIALQKEHRTALISAAVTGKIDVRDEIIERKAA